MNRTLFDRPPGAELTGRDLRRTMPTSDASRVRRRLLMLAGAFAIGFTGLSVRVIDLAGPITAPELVASAEAAVVVEPAPVVRPDWRERGEITDRNGQLLAVDLPTQALMVHVRRARDPERLARQIARALGDDDPAAILARFQAARSSTTLRWRLTPAQIAAVHDIGDPAIEMLPTVTRSYPAGRLAAHVTGFVDSVGTGRAGLERTFNTRLQDPAGQPVRASIDLGVQHVMRSEIAAAMQTYSAIGGAGIVMDVNSGEIVSLVSLPDYDPNRRDPARDDAFFNRATYGRYEMGSTFKSFTAAMALEVGRHRLSDSYDATDPIKRGRFLIRDYHPEKRWLTIAEIFKYSSNIGAAKMAVDVGTAGQQRFLGALGLLDPVPVELPETIEPQRPLRWNELETMTISYGHGLSVSPLHLVAGIGALVNGGEYVQPTLLVRDAANPATVRPVLSRQTSENMRRLFRLVVRDGTGKSADARGYLVGGKTGTAEKAVGRGYARKRLITSFVGAFPMHAPRYVVLVMLDEPQATKQTFGYATAGWNAAPTVGRIIPRIAPLLGVAPASEEDPAINDALSLPAAAQKREVRNATL